MRHPVFLTPFELTREHDATTRDLTDLVVLSDLRQAIEDALVRVGRAGEIRHPDARWSTGELVEALQAELTNIAGEAGRIRRGPVVLEDEG